MWCTYFSKTSVVVAKQGRIVGFISAFIKPETPNTLFVWQVAVDATERGKGLATEMLQYLLEAASSTNINYLEATISPSNIPSQKLFLGIANKLDTVVNISPCFTATDFPEAGHEDEQVHLVGPFKNNNKK